MLKATETKSNRQHSVNSAVKYDLVGKLAEGTQLTRRTVVDILKGLNVAVIAQFKTNPEHFIAEARRLINGQKATMIDEHLAYDPVEERYELDIFTAGQTKQDFSNSGAKLDRHIYDYALTDSNTEREFVKVLDTASEVVVYAKLPRGFLIPTPVGDYYPDWSIAFKEGWSSTCTSSPRPRAQCRRWSCARSKRPKSHAPESSSTRPCSRLASSATRHQPPSD